MAVGCSSDGRLEAIVEWVVLVPEDLQKELERSQAALSNLGLSLYRYLVLGALLPATSLDTLSIYPCSNLDMVDIASRSRDVGS